MFEPLSAVNHNKHVLWCLLFDWLIDCCGFTLIRARDDADRSASEAARAKALIADLERQLAAARSEAKAASDAVARAGREAGELKQVGGGVLHTTAVKQGRF